MEQRAHRLALRPISRGWAGASPPPQRRLWRVPASRRAAPADLDPHPPSGESAPGSDPMHNSPNAIVLTIVFGKPSVCDARAAKRASL